mgnify:FL=1
MEVSQNNLSPEHRIQLHEYLINRFGQTPDWLTIKPLQYIIFDDSLLPVESFLRHNSIEYEKNHMDEIDKIPKEFLKLKEELGEYFATRKMMEKIKKLLS